MTRNVLSDEQTEQRSKESEPIRVGSTLYNFDINKREYKRDARGRSYGGPIWREHWRPVEVVGETSRSWLVGYVHSPTKVPKKDFENGACPSGWARSMEQIERLEWVDVHRHRIAEKVRSVSDDEVLHAVARLIGYDENEER